MGEGLRYCVIIPVRPDQEEISALVALREADVDGRRVEVLVARGQSPSAQRNAAIREAKADILLFLDDDSRVHPSLFKVLDEHFQDETIHGVGGPNLGSSDASPWATAKDLSLTSAVGAPRVRARYVAVGTARDATEDDLILCNFAIRRDVFQRESPFDERLYPNEENELFHRLTSRGIRLVYDPQAVVYRRRAEGPWRFSKRIARYGRGRMEQTLYHPSVSGFFHLLPLGLLGLLLLTVFWPSHLWWCLWGAYSTVLGAEAARCSWKAKRPLLFPLVVQFLLSLHFSYAVGMFLGFLGFPWRWRRRPRTAAVVERAKDFDVPFSGERGEK